MTGKEFAEKYAGRLAKTKLSPGTCQGPIVGYLNFLGVDYVVVAWPPGWSRAQFNFTPTIDASSYLRFNGIGVDYIELVKPEPVVVAFPSKCKICAQPCRKIGTFVLCSNQKCKSRSGFKKFLKQFPKPPKILRYKDFKVGDRVRIKYNHKYVGVVDERLYKPEWERLSRSNIIPVTIDNLGQCGERPEDLERIL